MNEETIKNHWEAVLREIIASEWAMFDRVQNIGGRASCQDDYKTFFIMRHSQMSSWDEPVLESYRDDHRAAARAGVNLIERKYAYMMQYTDPVYYKEQLEPHLPPVTPAKRGAVDAVAAIYALWHRQARTRYPAFVGRGRPETEEDGGGTTSVDAYLKGELLSYSERTLSLLRDMVENRGARGENLVCAIYDETARAYGYAGLEEAEAALRRRVCP